MAQLLTFNPAETKPMLYDVSLTIKNKIICQKLKN